MDHLQAVRKDSLQDQALEVLRTAILSGKLEPHTIYSIAQVAQILNVSRTPVTTAVQTIAAQGLITILPNQGFRIYEFSEDDVRQVFELRKAVEGYILERFIETNAKTVELQRHLKAQEVHLRKADVSSFLKEDRDFHRVLAENVGNPRIVQTLQNIRDLVAIMNLEIMAESERGQQVIREHAKVLEAIEHKNETAAKKALYYHFDNTVAILARRIREAKMPPEKQGRETRRTFG